MANLNPLWLIFIAIGLAVTGQMFMKQGITGFDVGAITIVGFIPLFVKMLLRPFVFIGFACFLISSFFWLIALSRVPLSYAYPMVSISYVLILFLSWIIFKENVALVRWFGAGVIMLGVYLISRSG